MIVTRNSDGLVLYALRDGAALDLTVSPAIVDGIRVYDQAINSAFCTAVPGVKAPDDFQVGWYTYTAGSFHLTATGTAAKAATAKALAQPELDAFAKSSFIAGLKGKANSLIRQGKTAEAMKLLIKAQDLTHG